MNQERRGLILVVVVLLISVVLGGIYRPSVRATSTATDEYQTAVSNFTSVLSVVQANYAEPVDADKAVYQGAIPGMLRMLDPHSNFFDARQFAVLRPGDVIAKVDEKSTEGLTTSEVADLLKGPKGTVVKITVIREGYPEPL